jgi:hypothetical protein
MPAVQEAVSPHRHNHQLPSTTYQLTSPYVSTDSHQNGQYCHLSTWLDFCTSYSHYGVYGDSKPSLSVDSEFVVSHIYQLLFSTTVSISVVGFPQPSADHRAFVTNDSEQAVAPLASVRQSPVVTQASRMLQNYPWFLIFAMNLSP